MQQAPASMMFEYVNREASARELKQFDIPEGTPWPEVLEKFVGFLSTVYGYDISPNVAVIEGE